MTVVGTIANRFKIYTKGVLSRQKSLDALSYTIYSDLKFNFNYTIEYNLFNAITTYSFIVIVCNALCDMILFFFIFIAFVITYSLVHNDLDERTFDNGMLRTLGMK